MKYNVIITQNALDDIAELFNYIKTALNEPTVASEMKKVILSAVDSLEEFPMRSSIIDTEPFHSSGVRKILVKNYFIFYRVHEDRVVILRILYNRRDWHNIL